jgi:plastocyanin
MGKNAAFSVAAGAAMLFVFVTASVPLGGQAGGTIVGHVHYMGQTPVNSLIRMGADPRCNRLYVGKRPLTQSFTVDASGNFADVLVSLDGSFPNTPVPATPVVLNQKDCQYAPHVLGARAGQTLQVKNLDATEHNIHAASTVGNEINTTQPIGGPVYDVKLKTAELLHVRCDNHTWMSSYIAIMDNPYFAVSGTDGTFTINNVPAGKQTVKAWHEVMGMQSQMVDVQAGKTITVDFTFAPGRKTARVPVHDLVVPMQMATLLTR